MVRKLEIDMIVPQHGTKFFKGNVFVNKFIDWADQLSCGADVIPAEVFSGTIK